MSKSKSGRPPGQTVTLSDGRAAWVGLLHEPAYRDIGGVTIYNSIRSCRAWVHIDGVQPVHANPCPGSGVQPTCYFASVSTLGQYCRTVMVRQAVAGLFVQVRKVLPGNEFKADRAAIFKGLRTGFDVPRLNRRKLLTKAALGDDEALRTLIEAGYLDLSERASRPAAPSSPPVPSLDGRDPLDDGAAPAVRETTQRQPAASGRGK